MNDQEKQTRLTQEQKIWLITNTLRRFLGHPERLGFTAYRDHLDGTVTGVTCRYAVEGEPERMCALGCVMTEESLKAYGAIRDDAGELISYGSSDTDPGLHFLIDGRAIVPSTLDVYFYSLLQTLHDDYMCQNQEEAGEVHLTWKMFRYIKHTFPWYVIPDEFRDYYTLSALKEME